MIDYKCEIDRAIIHSSEETEAYTFFTKDYDVHIFLVICEVTGYIMIDSCYGQFCHSWPSFKSRGHHSLKNFLFNRPKFSYIMNKFSYGRNKEFRVFYAEETVNKFRREILSLRYGQDIDGDLARKMYDEMDGLEELTSPDAYYHLSENFGEWFPEPHEHFLFGYTYHQKLMMEHVLPEIAKWFCNNVDLNLNCKEMKQQGVQL